MDSEQKLRSSQCGNFAYDERYWPQSNDANNTDLTAGIRLSQTIASCITSVSIGWSRGGHMVLHGSHVVVRSKACEEGGGVKRSARNLPSCHSSGAV